MTNVSFQTPEEYKKALQTYISEFDRVDAEVKVIELRKTSNGSVEEESYDVSWKARGQASRLSYASITKRDGEVAFVRAKDIVTVNNILVQWNHTGFPGSVQFGGVSKTPIQKLLKTYNVAVDPRGAFVRVSELMSHPDAKVESQSEDRLLIVIAPRDEAGKLARLEVVIEKKVGWLPVSVVRKDSTSDKLRFEAGAGYTFDYELNDSIGKHFPKRIVESIPLKEGASGTTLREWNYTKILAQADGSSRDELVLTLPDTAKVTNAVTDKPLSLKVPDERAAFLDPLDGMVKVTEPAIAALWMRDNTVGGTYDHIPKSFIEKAEAIVRERESIPPRNGTTRLFIFVNLAVIAALLFFILKARVFR